MRLSEKSLTVVLLWPFRTIAINWEWLWLREGSWQWLRTCFGCRGLVEALTGTSGGENWLRLNILHVCTDPMRDLHGPESHRHQRWGASSIGVFGIHLPHSWGAVELLWERGPNQVFSTGILTFIVSRLADTQRHIKGRQRAGECSVNINPTVEAAHLWVLAPVRILRACQMWVKEREETE